MSDITLKLTKAEVKHIIDDARLVTAIGSTIARKAEDALRDHEREEKRAALELPWVARKRGCGPQWGLCHGAGFLSMTKEQATLMAAAPELAAALEAVYLDYGLIDRGTEPHDTIEAVLKKSGWLP